jgi:hypothetical protein
MSVWFVGVLLTPFRRVSGRDWGQFLALLILIAMLVFVMRACGGE